MSIKKKISIYNVITALVEDTNEEFLRNLHILLRWAKIVDQLIGGKQNYEERLADLEIIDGGRRVLLPQSAVTVYSFKPGEYEELGLDEYKGYIPGLSPSLLTSDEITFRNTTDPNWDYVNPNRKTIDSETSYPYQNQGTGNWDVVDNHLVFEQLITDYEKVCVHYLSYITDAEGYPMINEGRVDAISSYLQWRMAKKENWKSFMRRQLSGHDFSFTIMLKEEARNAVKYVRASEQEPNSYNSDLVDLVTHPLRGRSVIDLTGAWNG